MFPHSSSLYLWCLPSFTYVLEFVDQLFTKLPAEPCTGIMLRQRWTWFFLPTIMVFFFAYLYLARLVPWCCTVWCYDELHCCVRCLVLYTKAWSKSVELVDLIASQWSLLLHCSSVSRQTLLFQDSILGCTFFHVESGVSWLNLWNFVRKCNTDDFITTAFCYSAQHDYGKCSLSALWIILFLFLGHWVSGVSCLSAASLRCLPLLTCSYFTVLRSLHHECYLSYPSF